MMSKKMGLLQRAVHILLMVGLVLGACTPPPNQQTSPFPSAPSAPSEDVIWLAEAPADAGPAPQPAARPLQNTVNVGIADFQLLGQDQADILRPSPSSLPYRFPTSASGYKLTGEITWRQAPNSIRSWSFDNGVSGAPSISVDHILAIGAARADGPAVRRVAFNHIPLSSLPRFDGSSLSAPIVGEGYNGRCQNGNNFIQVGDTTFPIAAGSLTAYAAGRDYVFEMSNLTSPLGNVYITWSNGTCYSRLDTDFALLEGNLTLRLLDVIPDLQLTLRSDADRFGSEGTQLHIEPSNPDLPWSLSVKPGPGTAAPPANCPLPGGSSGSGDKSYAFTGQLPNGTYTVSAGYNAYPQPENQASLNLEVAHPINLSVESESFYRGEGSASFKVEAPPCTPWTLAITESPLGQCQIATGSTSAEGIAWNGVCNGELLPVGTYSAQLQGDGINKSVNVSINAVTPPGPTATPTDNPPSPGPTAIPTPGPSDSPAPTPSPDPTPTPGPTPSPGPTTTPTPDATATPQPGCKGKGNPNCATPPPPTPSPSVPGSDAYCPEEMNPHVLQQLGTAADNWASFLGGFSDQELAEMDALLQHGFGIQALDESIREQVRQLEQQLRQLREAISVTEFAKKVADSRATAASLEAKVKPSNLSFGSVAKRANILAVAIEFVKVTLELSDAIRTVCQTLGDEEQFKQALNVLDDWMRKIQGILRLLQTKSCIDNADPVVTQQKLSGMSQILRAYTQQVLNVAQTWRHSGKSSALNQLNGIVVQLRNISSKDGQLDQIRAAIWQDCQEKDCISKARSAYNANGRTLPVNIVPIAGQPCYIYRAGQDSPSNLTPSIEDLVGGLSFSPTVVLARTSNPNQFSKFGALEVSVQGLNAGGLLAWFDKDGAGRDHVSVKPGSGSMQVWGYITPTLKAEFSAWINALPKPLPVATVPQLPGRPNPGYAIWIQNLSRKKALEDWFVSVKRTGNPPVDLNPSSDWKHVAWRNNIAAYPMLHKLIHAHTWTLEKSIQRKEVKN